MPTLEFKGKQHIWAHHLTVPYRPLVPDPEKSVGEPAIDGNLVIHGDNLEGLKALLPRYAGRVNCIYIDPPYNTGNEAWVYNDNANGKLLQEWFASQSPVDGEDLVRHDKWLCMMWPRIQLLKELLADDGVILVSIDDNEQHHLRTIMDEIFGEPNALAHISWQGMDTTKNDARFFSDNHENIHVYAKDIAQSKIGGIKKTEKQRRYYKNRDDDPRGDYLLTPLHAKSGTEESIYEYTFPNGQVWSPPPGRYPTYSRARLQQLVESGEIYLDPKGKAVPQRKTYWKDASDRMRPPTFWPYEQFGSTRQANAELRTILGRAAFDNPKPSKLIRTCIDIAAGPDAVILDSFAGSGTTAQAVLALNKEDGGNRKFILVECEDYADTITAERVRRVIAGVPEANEKDTALRGGLGGTFTYCTLGEPITVEGMLTGDGLPEFPALAAWLLHTATGVSAGTTQLHAMDDDGHFYSDEQRDYFLLYEPSVEWLQSEEAVLNERRAKRIGAARTKEAIVFGAAKYISQQDLTAEYRITFCQLPYEIHRLR